MGILNEEEFWNDYLALTGLSAPFANSLRYKLGPIIEKLPVIRSKRSFDVHCFETLQHRTLLSGFTERLLLLEFKSRATGKIDVNEWRAVLCEELEIEKLFEERIVENIRERGMNYQKSVAIHAGSAKNLKRKLASNYEVKTVCLEHYWKSPLEVLKTLFALKGVDNVPDNTIRLCVRQHLGYLNYILLHDNVDSSHNVWVKEFKPHKIPKLASKMRKSNGGI